MDSDEIEKTMQHVKHVRIFIKNRSVLLPERLMRFALCPFGIRVKRTSPDCYPPAVSVIIDTREYYPFGKTVVLSPADFI